MNDRTIGWGFVGAQAAFLGALIVLPVRNDWSRPGWLTGLGFVLVALGLIFGAIASLGLGRALTPTPVPNDTGLKTRGLYRWVRHPIYSAVLVIVVGPVLRSGSLVSVVIGVGTIVFFHFKAAWEERRLAEWYPGYAAYAARTGRFLPHFGQRNPKA